MNKFIEAAQKKHEDTVQQRQKEYKRIDKICIDQNLLRMRENGSTKWKGM